MTLGIPTGGPGGGGNVSVTHEVLWATDPRISPAIDITGGTDCTAGLQAMANLMVGAPQSGGSEGLRVGYLPPGLYKKSAEIDFATGSANPCVLQGAGSKGNRVQAPTCIWDVTDAGAGKWSIKPTGSADFSIKGIAFQGSQGGTVRGVSHGYLMRGVPALVSGTFEDVGASGYATGLGISTDHVTFIDTGWEGNDYGVEILPLNPTQGDIHFYVCRAGACSYAALAVASSSALGGMDLIDFEGSTSPYGILRYSDGLGQDVTANWITALTAKNFATEYTGNGVIYDAVGNGAGLTGLDWDHGGAGNWALFTGSNAWAGKPQVAAFYNSGPISGVIRNSPPTAGTNNASQACPAILAPSIYIDFPDDASGIPGQVSSGQMICALTSGQNGSHLKGSAFGTKRGYRACVVPYFLDNGITGGIQQGQCIVPWNVYNVGVYNSSTNGQQVLAIAGHNAAATAVVHGIEAGDEIQVLNSSGSSIAFGTPLGPHSAGGVQAWTSGQQRLGYSFGTIAAGTLGPAQIKI